MTWPHLNFFPLYQNEIKIHIGSPICVSHHFDATNGLIIFWWFVISDFDQWETKQLGSRSSEQRQNLLAVGQRITGSGFPGLCNVNKETVFYLKIDSHVSWEQLGNRRGQKLKVSFFAKFSSSKSSEEGITFVLHS